MQPSKAAQAKRMRGKAKKYLHKVSLLSKFQATMMQVML